MADTNVLNVLHAFSRFPLGRYKADGPNSGEALRDLIVLKLNNSDRVLEVNFTGVAGCPPSFMEECFGGLLREGGFTKEQLDARLQVTQNDGAQNAKEWAQKFIAEEAER